MMIALHRRFAALQTAADHIIQRIPGLRTLDAGVRHIRAPFAAAAAYVDEHREQLPVAPFVAAGCADESDALNAELAPFDADLDAIVNSVDPRCAAFMEALHDDPDGTIRALETDPRRFLNSLDERHTQGADHETHAH